MNRFHGIGVALIGLVVTILSALKVVPLLATGSFLILLGLLLFGLSFIPKPEEDAAAAPRRMTTPETLMKIFYAPTEVFQNLRRHPRWLVVLLIGAVVSSLYSAAFYYRMTPERITNYTVDKIALSGFVPADKVEEVRRQTLETATNPISRVGAAINNFCWLIFLTAFFALIFWLFAMALGGQINYWQAFSVAAYANFAYWIIKYLLSAIILFIKDPADIHPILGQGSLVTDNLGALITPSQNPVLFTLLTGFGLLWLYWIWLNSTGLRSAGERVTPTIAWSATLFIWIIGIVLGVISALLFPSFLS